MKRNVYERMMDVYDSYLKEAEDVKKNIESLSLKITSEPTKKLIQDKLTKFDKGLVEVKERKTQFMQAYQEVENKLKWVDFYYEDSFVNRIKNTLHIPPVLKAYIDCDRGLFFLGKFSLSPNAEMLDKALTHELKIFSKQLDEEEEV